ncbi:MgtC/SapB family protein [Porphyromonas loveana]|uniref:MgtC/SapB family protein n=1 Tax=Porphyromonas loveana TaxID=1884669 RepID=UPI0035A00F93
MELWSSIPKEVINFVLVLLFSFSLGMEQHKQSIANTDKKVFGTDRTFTFFGLLGYVLLLPSKDQLWPFLIGFVVIACFMMIFYLMRIREDGQYGLTTVMLGLLVYTFPLLIDRSPLWISLLIFVVVLILAEIKKPLQNLSAQVSETEFITLAKFITIAFIVLPSLPNEDLSPMIPVSPYRIWLAVVVVSAVSYFSYLLRRYMFPKASLILSGILGGLYSSMVTTIILAKQSKEKKYSPQMYAGAIIIASAMMYFRVYVLLFIFNRDLALASWLYFLLLFLVSMATGYFLYKRGEKVHGDKTAVFSNSNPLEFKVAVVFAGLYLLFSAVTQFMVTHFGDAGLTALSFIVGFTDITPFLLNLFQGHYSITSAMVLIATMQVMVSNNILKSVYTRLWSTPETTKWTWRGFGIIIVLNVAVILLLYLL